MKMLVSSYLSKRILGERREDTYPVVGSAGQKRKGEFGDGDIEGLTR